jgi:hypothetical protein
MITEIKKFIYDMLSVSDSVSSNRVAFLLIIFSVLTLIIFYILVAIKGTVYGIPTVEILDKMNYLILGILGSGIITKNVGKFLENNKKDGE